MRWPFFTAFVRKWLSFRKKKLCSRSKRFTGKDIFSIKDGWLLHLALSRFSFSSGPQSISFCSFEFLLPSNLAWGCWSLCDYSNARAGWIYSRSTLSCHKWTHENSPVPTAYGRDRVFIMGLPFHPSFLRKLVCESWWPFSSTFFPSTNQGGRWLSR